MTARKPVSTLDLWADLEQLDLFAGAPTAAGASDASPACAPRSGRDAAQAAAREWEAHLADERNAARAARAELAPRIYAPTGVRGYWARRLAFDRWVTEYGHFNCYALSHGWHLSITNHDPDASTGECRPSTLEADLGCHHRGGCSCVGGGFLHRGVCLRCDWEGPARDGENSAVEDAHDHAWPGWRDLPCVTRRPEPGTNARQKKTMASWEADVDDVYPAGWLAAGGPIRTMRNQGGTRHVPGGTGTGGYDLCAGVTPRPLGATR